MKSNESIPIEREIEYLELKIRERTEAITVMRNRMAQYQKRYQERQSFNSVPQHEKEQLTYQLKLYRKLIHLPSDSSKTCLDQTKEVFQNQDDKLRNLEEQIEQLEQTIGSIREKAPPVRDLLAELRIEVPNFRAIVDQNFKDWLNTANGIFNRKLLSSFKSKSFMKKEIQNKLNQKNKLFRNLKAIAPPPRKIQLETPAKYQFKNKPKQEFSKCESYNSMILNKMYKNAKTAMQNYKSRIDIGPEESNENSQQQVQNKVVTPVGRARTTSRDFSRNSSKRTSVRLEHTTAPQARRQQFKSVNLTGTQPLELNQNAPITTASSANMLDNQKRQIKHSNVFELNKAFKKLNDKIQILTKMLQSFAIVKYQVQLCLEDQKMAISYTNCCSNEKLQRAKEKFRQTKERVNDEKEELDSLLMDIPDQWKGSAEGLLKWQEQLLSNQKKNQELRSQITNEKNQISDLKVIRRKRISTLRRTRNQSPKPILGPLPNET